MSICIWVDAVCILQRYLFHFPLFILKEMTAHNSYVPPLFRWWRGSKLHHEGPGSPGSLLHPAQEQNLTLQTGTCAFSWTCQGNILLNYSWNSKTYKLEAQQWFNVYCHSDFTLKTLLNLHFLFDFFFFLDWQFAGWQSQVKAVL